MNAVERCFARVDHAKELAGSLGEIVASVQLPADTLEFLGELEVGQRISGVVRCDSVMPVTVSLAFGDVLHNLRSALDNLAWALAEMTTATPNNRTSFPIVLEESRWKDVAADRLRNVAPDAAEFIRSHQPFMRRNPFSVPGGIAPEDNVLARLAAYSNSDKHRIPVVLAGFAVDAAVQSIHATDCELTPLMPTAGPIPMREGTPVLEFLVTQAGPDASIVVDGSVAWMAALESGEHIMQFVDLAHAYVHDLVVESRQHLQPDQPVTDNHGPHH